MNENVEKFILHLRELECSQATIDSYSSTIQRHFDKYGDLTRQSVLTEKAELIERRRLATTINQHLSAYNKFLEFKNGNKSEEVKHLKIQRKTFKDNVITNLDYQKMLSAAILNDKSRMFYFVLKVLALTGVRVSELVELKRESVLDNNVTLLGKGNKFRKIFIPANLHNELCSWIIGSDKIKGYLFFNRYGEKLSARGVSSRLHYIARLAKVDQSRVYPHSFRHFYAKQFLKRSKDISILCDLMGHTNIATTQIYMRRSQSEQQRAVNKIVAW